MWCEGTKPPQPQGKRYGVNHAVKVTTEWTFPGSSHEGQRPDLARDHELGAGGQRHLGAEEPGRGERAGAALALGQALGHLGDGADRERHALASAQPAL